MVVCKYWRNGTCRNGSNCRFEHPNGQNSSNQTGGSQNNNNGQGDFGGRGGVFGNISRPERWQLNEDDIRNDLTSTRPKWILSAYGPGKEPPASLFVENEYSPEEVRWRFYEQQAKGSADAADQEAIKVWNDADSAMRTAAANVRDVQQFMEQKEKEHPNRYDFTNIKFDGKISREEYAKNSQLNQQPGSSINPFGGTSNRITPSTNLFSRPAFGESSSLFTQPAQSSSFGQPAQTSSFGQPSQPSQPSGFGKPAQTAAFGQTAFGQPSQPSAFGQAAQSSAFGQPTQPSAFGQPAQSSGFGQPAQPSAFGKPAFGQSGFGQAGSGQNSSPFGQAKPAFGQLANSGGSSPFGGKSAESAAGSGFGQTSSPGQSNNPFVKPSAASGFGNSAAGSGFGQTGFGQTAAPAGNASPFGQQAGSNNAPSSFGQANAQQGNSSPFGGNPRSGASASPFGGNPTSRTSFGASPFGKPARQGSGFGQPQQPSAFGQPAQPQQEQSAFGQPTQPPAGFGASPFNKPTQQPGFGQSPFGQQSQPQPQSGFGQQKSSFSSFGPSPFGPAAPEQNPQGTQPNGQSVTQAEQPAAQPSSTKPTDRPVQPLHYTQTLRGALPQLQQGEALTAYRSMPVTYITKLRPSADGTEVVDSRTPVYARPDGKGQERIWFPQGAQNPDVVKLARALSDLQACDEKYTDEVKGVYGRLFETGRFEPGKIPLVPPMRGWIDYDF